MLYSVLISSIIPSQKHLEIKFDQISGPMGAAKWTHKVNHPGVYTNQCKQVPIQQGTTLSNLQFSQSQGLSLMWSGWLLCPLLQVPSFPALPSPPGAMPSICHRGLHSSLALHGTFQCSINCHVSQVHQGISPLEVLSLAWGTQLGGGGPGI